MSASQTDTNDEDAREEQAAFLTDLKERLHKAEIEAEERQKQVDVLNARLDEALREQAKLEERAHEEEERAESLEADKQKLTRQQRELEGIYEAERAQTMKDKDEAQTRVDELQETIQRLKETMAKKNVEGSDGEDGKLSRTCASTTISLSLGTMNRTDTVQQASAITPPATAPRRT
jgi:chromosome segregation ATPase